MFLHYRRAGKDKSRRAEERLSRGSTIVTFSHSLYVFLQSVIPTIPSFAPCPISFLFLVTRSKNVEDSGPDVNLTETRPHDCGFDPRAVHGGLK